MKRFCISFTELIFIFFFLSEFCFQFGFFFNFDFQMHKIHLKSFVFAILFIGYNSSTFYLLDGKG